MLFRCAPLFSSHPPRPADGPACTSVQGLCPFVDAADLRISRVHESRTSPIAEENPVNPAQSCLYSPDWVCEIVSPGHERKDTLKLFLLLHHRVPFYCLIWPEDRVLIAHQLDGDSYRVVKTISGEARARIPPFDSVELDLAYILGE